LKVNKKMISGKNILKLEIRQKIYKCIEKNPGIHIRELSRKSNIPFATLKYHIRFLEKINIIHIKKDNIYKRLYPKKSLSKLDKEILGLFRNKTPCKIFISLIFLHYFSPRMLEKELEIPHSTLKYYIRKMEKVGIIEEATVENGLIHPFVNPRRLNVAVECRPIGREKFYKMKNQEVIQTAYKLLISHKHSFFDEKLIDLYIYYVKDNKKNRNNPPKVSPNVQSQFENVIGVFNSIFKPPFCA